jgi:Tol biopolymer transport system component
VNLGPPTWIGDRVLVWQRVSDTTRLSLVDVNGAAAASSAGLRVPFDAVQIRPSPDGRQLLFLHGDRRRPHIGIASIDGSDLHDITDGSAPVGNADWSRDGKRIAFTVVDSASHGQIAVINADGSGYRVVTHIDSLEGLPQWANWAPDGKRLVIQAGKYNRTKIEESTAHLWVVDVATGEANKLAPHTGFSLDETPCWFPDGKRIAFQSNRNGVMEVWSMKPDGTDARVLTPLHP